MGRGDERIRVLLVDDSDEFRAAARELISQSPELVLVAEARDGREAVEAASRSGIDLILMDAVMPGLDGFEATRRIKASAGPPVVLIVTFHDSPAAVAMARDVGADGFVPKPELAERLMPSIRGLFPGRPGG